MVRAATANSDAHSGECGAGSRMTWLGLRFVPVRQPRANVAALSLNLLPHLADDRFGDRLRQHVLEGPELPSLTSSPHGGPLLELLVDRQIRTTGTVLGDDSAKHDRFRQDGVLRPCGQLRHEERWNQLAGDNRRPTPRANDRGALD